MKDVSNEKKSVEIQFLIDSDGDFPLMGILRMNGAREPCFGLELSEKCRGKTHQTRENFLKKIRIYFAKATLNISKMHCSTSKLDR